MSTPTNLDTLVQAFAAIRDARTIKRRAWEAEDLALEQDQDALKVVMLSILNQIGGKSVSTAHGTVFRTEKIKPSAADWSTVYDWIIANPERFELLEKRLKPTFIKQFMEENSGQVPPGVNVHREYEVTVRKT